MSERGGVVLRGSDLRLPAAAMLAVGAALPLLGHPGPGCFLRAMTDVPCPLCGMSTSVSSTVRGDLTQAAAVAPAGIFVVAFAVWVLLTGRPRHVRVPMPGVVLVLVVMWVFQLLRFSVL